MRACALLMSPLVMSRRVNMCMTGGSGREMARAGASPAEDLFSVKGRAKRIGFCVFHRRTTISFTSYVILLPY